jgi:hypothetical protein
VKPTLEIPTFAFSENFLGGREDFLGDGTAGVFRNLKRSRLVDQKTNGSLGLGSDLTLLATPLCVFVLNLESR